MLKRITNRHYKTFVSREQFDTLIAGKGETIDFHSVLMPGELLGQFASVRITGADIEDSLLYRLWGGLGLVNFIKDRELMGRLRSPVEYQEPPLTTYYPHEADWSKFFKLKVDVDGRTVEKATTQCAIDILGPDTLWVANAEWKGRVVEGIFKGQGTKLPPKSNGFNHYDHRHSIAVLLSSMPTPELEKFMAPLGVDRDTLRRLMYYSAAHQAISRTSLRNPTSTEPVNVFVPDRGLAEYLKSKYPWAKLVKVDAGWRAAPTGKDMGRPKKYASDEERRVAKTAQTAAWRAKKRAKSQDTSEV